MISRKNGRSFSILGKEPNDMALANLYGNTSRPGILPVAINGFAGIASWDLPIPTQSPKYEQFHITMPSLSRFLAQNQMTWHKQTYMETLVDWEFYQWQSMVLPELHCMMGSPKLYAKP